jgi:hypothetical protein
MHPGLEGREAAPAQPGRNPRKARFFAARRAAKNAPKSFTLRIFYFLFLITSPFTLLISYPLFRPVYEAHILW